MRHHKRTLRSCQLNVGKWDFPYSTLLGKLASRSSMFGALAPVTHLCCLVTQRNPGSFSDLNPWLLLYCTVASMTRQWKGRCQPLWQSSWVSYVPCAFSSSQLFQYLACRCQPVTIMLPAADWKALLGPSKIIPPYIKQANIKPSFPQSKTHTMCKLIWFEDWI